MDFKHIIENRRSVNLFDIQKDVPESLLKEMVEMAARTPSGFNIQPWSLILLKDQESKMRLQQHAWGQEKVSEAPVTMIVLADMDGWKFENKFAEKNFKEMIASGAMTPEQEEWFKNTCESLYGASEARRVAFATKNTGFFAMAMMLAAKSLGLDTHPMDGFDIDGVRKEFSIPENYWIPLLLAVGYFREGESLSPPKWRKSYDDIVISFDQ